MKYSFFLHIVFIFSFVFAQENTVYIDDLVEEAQYYKDSDNPTTWEILSDPYILNDKIEQRKFSEDFQSQYQTRDFDYHRNLPRRSLGDRIWDAFDELLSKIFKTQDVENINKISIWIFRIIAVGIVGLVLYWLIRFLLSKEGTWFLKRKDDKIQPELRTITENIHEIDFNTLIQRYESENDFRFATRYQYLKLLKLLNDKKFLSWDPDKTNLDYINELKNHPHQAAFARLTHVFDHVWYGDFQIDAETYAKYKTEFNQLIKSHE